MGFFASRAKAVEKIDGAVKSGGAHNNSSCNIQKKFGYNCSSESPEPKLDRNLLLHIEYNIDNLRVDEIHLDAEI